MELTQGHPLKQLFFFALPLVFGTVFQQLYSFVDTVLVGRFLGTDALGAVGVTYSLNFLVMGFVQGLCVGFGIVLAQRFGAKDREGLRRFFWNGVYLCAGISLLLAVVTILLTKPLLRLILTPDELLPLAAAYVQILFLGLPATVLYNYSASALRAVGDSQRPFYFLLLSSVVNIVLDYLFLVPLHGGVAGAAWATVLSQLLSGVLNSLWYFFRAGVLGRGGPRYRPSLECMGRLCAVGLPMGLEYSVSAIGAVVMQGGINTLGKTAVAAQTAGEKIRQMFTLPMESVGMAMATYTGQNYGAGRIDRIRAGIRWGLLLQYIYCAAAWLVIFLLKAPLTALVLGESVSPVAHGAIQYLTLISPLFFLHGSLMILRNTLQGLGKSLLAIISGIGELVGRSLGGLASAQLASFALICLTNPLAWGLGAVYCLGMTCWILNKSKEFSI